MIRAQLDKRLQLDQPVTSLSFRADGKLLAVGGGRPDADLGLIRVLECGAWRAVSQLPGHSAITRVVTFFPDGVHLASAGNEEARIWHLAKAEPLHELPHYGSPVLGVAASPDGAVVATAAGTGDLPGELGLWTAGDGLCRGSCDGHDGGVAAVAFDPQGRRIASAALDGALRVFAGNGGPKLTMRGHAAACTSIAWAPDGSDIASGSHDHTVRVWDAATGEERVELRAHSDAVNAVAFAPDGSFLVSASNDLHVRLFRRDGEPITAINFGAPVSALAFAPDGQRLAVACADGRVDVLALIPTTTSP